MKDIDPNERDSDVAADHEPARWGLLRDLVAFQFKLALDGIRDVLLSPVSLVAVFVGFMFGGAAPGQYFYRLLRFGRRTDHMIGLFSAADNYHDGVDDMNRPSISADSLVQNIEERIVEEYKQRDGLPPQSQRRLWPNLTYHLRIFARSFLGEAKSSIDTFMNWLRR